MKYIDYFLDRITMYRLLLYFLIVLIAAASGLSAIGVLHFNALAIILSAGLLTIICWLANKVFATIFAAPTNFESSLITALILTLIFAPYRESHDIIALTAAGGLAIASKYILAINKKHLFNPAALAAVLLAFGPKISAVWWVGSEPLLPIVIIGGLLIVRKINRSAMVWSYLLAAVGSSLVLDIITKHNAMTDLHRMLLNSSLFFLAFVMLTEPLTSPATKDKQIWYGALVGILFPPQVHFGSLYFTPELALIAGNIFAYIVSPKYKLLPKLKEKLKLAPDVMDFVFTPEKAINYKPGQYMEWTLAHDNVDSRGNRRYLTLASSPTEKDLRIGVKFYPQGSTFKQALLKITPQTPIAAGQLGGDFTLPDDQNLKLAFVAGGIGITPYRSMVKYMLDKREKRDTALLYSEKTEKEFVYRDVFDQARQHIGLKTIYTVTHAVSPGWKGQTGKVTDQMIAQQIPDYKERLFYISGPHGMVQEVEKTLKNMGLPGHQIKTDLFPGYA